MTPRHPRRALLAAAALVGAGVVVSHPADAAVTDTCLMPQLTDVALSQGPAKPTALVGGKSAIAKFWLGTASCLPVGATVRVTGATLQLNGGAKNIDLGGVLPLPTLAQSSTAPVADTPADVLFRIPGGDVRPVAGTNTMTFAVKVDYLVQQGTNQLRDSITFATEPFANNTTLQATVIPNMRGLRVLVVPMTLSTNTQPYTTQYTDSTAAGVKQGFLTLARQLPAPDGSVTYTTSGTAVTVDPFGTTGKYCSKGIGSSKTTPYGLALRLQQQRTEYNSAWPANAAHVDRVLGQIDPSISLGGSTGSTESCADGFAEMGLSSGPLAPGAASGADVLQAGPGNTAFGRTVTATSQGPIVGSVMAMEIAHTTGDVSQVYPYNKGPEFSDVKDSNRSDGLHSRYSAADPHAAGRVFNLDTTSLLPAGRSTMSTDLTGWNDDNTVYESQDWDYLLCSMLPANLGGGTALLPTQVTSCSFPGGLGGAASLFTNSTYAVSGATDGVSGYAITSQDGDSPLADPEVPGSLLHVVQLAADGAQLADYRIGINRTYDGHDHADAEQHSDASAELGVFGASVPAMAGTKTLQVKFGDRVLYERTVTQAPSFTNLALTAAGTLVNLTASAASPVPQNLLLDVFARTPAGETVPVAVGLTPDATTPATTVPGGATISGGAVFANTIDVSLVPPGSTLAYTVTDGIQSAHQLGGPIPQEVTDLVADLASPSPVAHEAALTAPTEGASIAQFARLPLNGDVQGADHVAWQLDLAGTSSTVSTARQDLVAPEVTGWPLPTGAPSATGTLSLIGYDAGGAEVGRTARPLTFVRDTDHDGWFDAADVTCAGLPALDDPTNATMDCDGDGYANLNDPDPLTSASTCIVNFSPTSLNRNSSGNPVTTNFSLCRDDLLGVPSDALYVLQIGGLPVGRITGDSRALPVTGFVASDSATGSGKVDRQALLRVLDTRLGYTPIFVGTLDGRVRGADQSAPVLFP